MPSRSAAESEWQKIQKAISPLAGAPYRIEEANLGEKGMYYRVQVGPYAESAARSLCDQVKAQKPGGCLVVR
ncbi:MAG: SPOR domain-containing protein [Alphaproteobacteria bacterium]|nr:SPOR domain-containing protein [Alphaproteobacteria bacterium]